MSASTPSPDRVLELIAAFGADPARWPSAERDAALALIALRPELAAAQSEAAALDQLLVAWDAPAPRPQARAAIIETARCAPQALPAAANDDEPPPRRIWRWGGAGLVAASLVAALMALPLSGGQSGTPATLPATPQVAGAGTPAMAQTPLTEDEMLDLVFSDPAWDGVL